MAMRVQRDKWGAEPCPELCGEVNTNGTWPPPCPRAPPTLQTPQNKHGEHLKAAPDGVLHERPRRQPGTVIVVEPVHELAAHQLHCPLKPRLGTQQKVSGDPKERSSASPPFPRVPTSVSWSGSFQRGFRCPTRALRLVVRA